MNFFKFLFKTTIVFFSIFLLFIFGAFIYIKLCPPLNINNTNNIIMYDNKNEVFFKGNNSKEWVSLDNISPYVINATVSCEDKNFFNHIGFDFLRIFHACYINLINKDMVQGASTITQQYAKNLFLNFDKTWKRKWDEMWYTLRLEDDFTKKDILEGYLNTINYGHGKYGIENASKFYFNKHAKELSLSEASILVGIPKSPANYSPLVNYNLAKNRQLSILNLMVKNNYITENEKNDAYNDIIDFTKNNNKKDISSVMFYKDAVLNELKTIDKFSNNYENLNGLKIYTSLNIDMQEKLEKSIKKNIPINSKLQVASVMMDPKDGSIISLIGGTDYNISSFNRATDSYRQVGSTMKPFLYYSALENGFTSSSSFISEPTTFSFNKGKSYTPHNYNDKYGNKPISMAAAIAYSENIYAVKTHLFLGYDSLINVARRVGITSKLESIPSLALGTNEINIIEMASGYSVFANLGYKIKPHLIKKIEDNKGNVLYETENDKNLVLNPSLVFILNNLLTSTYDPAFIDYNYPTAINLSSKLSHTYSLKSGTTNTDNWYIGYNNNIVSAVWVGYDDNEDLNKNQYKYSQNIWYDSVEFYDKGKDNKSLWYKVPKNISAMFVEPISGRPIKNDKSKKKLMYYLKGTEPRFSDKVFDEIDDISKAT